MENNEKQEIKEILIGKMKKDFLNILRKHAVKEKSIQDILSSISVWISLTLDQEI